MQSFEAKRLADMSKVRMLCSSFSAGAGLVIGVGVGAAIGVATGNMAVWVGVGTAIGVAVAASSRREEADDE